MRETRTRAVIPEIYGKDGFTWVVYGDLTHSGFVHGILVFKNVPFNRDRDRWRREAAGILRSHLEVSPERIVIPGQVHSSRVRRIGRTGDEPSIVCDGLVTDEPRVMVGVSIADCVPLFAVNPKDRRVGIAHCGWRGVAGGIVEEFESAMSTGVRDPAGTQYLIGASIGPCCYEVREDMLAHFSDDDKRDHVVKKVSVPFFSFDLKGLVASRLRRRGVVSQQICVDNTCTSCQKYVLCSYRADGRDCGRMLAYVMLTG